MFRKRSGELVLGYVKVNGGQKGSHSRVKEWVSRARRDARHFKERRQPEL